MNSSKKYLYVGVVALLLVIGVSLAYFGIKIIGNDTAKGNKVVTGNLELTFTDTNEITLDNAFPGDSFTKTISVKNTGTKDVSYNLVWTELTNGIINNELVIEATCKRLNSSGTEEGTCSSISQKAVSSDSNITSNIPIKPGYTHEYTVKIIFIDTGKPQNYNKNKTFEGKLGITESSAKTVYCTYDGELTQGAEYVNGQYTYRYMQESDGEGWSNITSDGWGVKLIDRTKTDEISENFCTYINDKPIISMSSMFYGSQATSIDLNNFNTSNITNMSNMFENSQATSINVSNFNTSKVTDMEGMFYKSQASILDLSNFDTSNVTNMGQMFFITKATIIDLSNFNTSSVTNMNRMFYELQDISLDISSFDTSKVIDMWAMFSGSQVSTLDLSSFDTSEVNDMSEMFNNAINLKTIYASDKFNIDNITTDSNMFNNCTNLIGGAGTTYDSTKTDKTYARIDGGTSNPGYFTDIADKPKEPESFTTDSWATISNAVRNGNIGKYNVGDTKIIDMGTYGTHTLRIANTSTPSECSTEGFSQSACGFVLEFADVITAHAMNDDVTNVGGWPASSMHTFVNTDIYNALPSELRNVIIDTTTVSGHGSTSGETNFTSTDKLYLLAPKDIYIDFPGSFANYDTAKDLTRQLDYYKKIGVTTSSYSGAIKKNGSSADYWWLRTAFSDDDYTFLCMIDNGFWDACAAHRTYYGVSPAFRIG